MLVVAAACRGRAEPPGAPCSTVASRFEHLARRDLGSGGSNALRSGVLAQLPVVRDTLARLCSEGQWSPAVRDCRVAADDKVALEACELGLTDEQRAALDR